MKINYSKFSKKDKQLIINMYPYMGTKIIKKYNLPFTKEEVRAMARKLGVKKKVRHWTLAEDKVACECYLKHETAVFANEVLIRIGIEPRTINCMKSKIRNFKFLDTGVGYYGYSNQAMMVYIEMTGNKHPYLKPERKRKGGEF